MSIPILKPNSSWFTPNLNTTTRTIITLINILDTYTPTSTITDSWDASVEQDGSIMCYVEGTTLTIAGNSSGKIALSEDARYTFSNIEEIIEAGTSVVENLDTFSAVTAINGLNILDTSAVTAMDYMFHRCKKLVTIDVSSFDTSNVTSMSHMFGANKNDPMAFTSITFGSNFVTNKVTDLSYMFYYNNYLTALDIDDWDVSNVVNMSNMCRNCTALTTFGPKALADWNTGNVVYMDEAFRSLQKLTALAFENWNVSKVKTFYCAFLQGAWATVLDLEAWDTSSCEDMSFIFWGFKTLTTLKVNTWDVSNVVTFDHFVAQMGSNFKNFDTSNWNVSSKCKNLNAVFHSFKGTTLDISKWDTSGVEVFCQMFDGCSNLTEIKGLDKLNTSNGRDFTQMFSGNKIKHLDLSSFDTRKAVPEYPISKNDTYGAGMGSFMYGSWNTLEKITFGKNFSFDGDGTCVGKAGSEGTEARFTLPKSKSGYWYSLDGTQYLNTEIPDDTAGTYFTSRDAAIKEGDSKKYMSFNSMRIYHEKLVNSISIDDITSEDIQSLFN